MKFLTKYTNINNITKIRNKKLLHERLVIIAELEIYDKQTLHILHRVYSKSVSTSLGLIEP